MWDKLPLEYNWKTYWEENPSAKIIHFHGSKPFQKEVLVNYGDEILSPLATDKYFEFCSLWDEYYREAEK